MTRGSTQPVTERSGHRRWGSVRSKLLVFATMPVVVTAAALLVLFIWGNRRCAQADEQALLWERHAHALDEVDAAVRLYFDSVGDSTVDDVIPHAQESLEQVARARAELMSLSAHFPRAEQLSDQRLDVLLGSFLAEGARVGKDLGRLHALSRKENAINSEIHARVREEEAGRVAALHRATELSHSVRVGGFLVATLMLIAATSASVLAVRAFGGRVASLERVAGRVATGHLEAQLPVTSSDELGRLANSLNEMVDGLRSQRTRQLSFLAAVAHDLRNPLAPMKLAAESILHAPDLPADSPIRKPLGVLERQIGRLSRMADDLVDAAGIEAGALTLALQECDLTAVARDVVDLYAASSSRHPLRLDTPSERVDVICDPTRIAQVIENLISNAIKYSPAGGPIDVTLSANVDEASIVVADHGGGIDPAMLEMIFEPFRRVEPTRSGIPGLGLGLSTCRWIVTAHGGRIDVASQPGHGSTFSIHLPRKGPRPVADVA